MIPIQFLTSTLNMFPPWKLSINSKEFSHINMHFPKHGYSNTDAYYGFIISFHLRQTL